MKILVTILQCRRVVLPHLFMEYSLPMMKKIPGIDINVHLIQHDAPKNFKSRMATSSYPIEKETLVNQWTKKGKYSGAIITSHNEFCSGDPSIPSWRKGFEYALESDADFFLWLEDDAFVYDTDCNLWPEILKDSLIGFYRDQPNGYIRNAHYVCNKKFVKLFLPFLRDQSLWNIHASIFSDEKNRVLNIDAPRMESMITKLAGTSKKGLNSDFAGRYSSRPEGQQKLKKLIQRVCPADASMLSIDFPTIS